MLKAEEIGSKLLTKVVEALDGFLEEEDSVEEIKDAISEHFDLQEAIKGLLEDQDDARVILQEKIKILLLQEVEKREELLDFYDDEDDMNKEVKDAINESLDLPERFNTVLEDDGVRIILQEKIKTLLINEIELREELSDFYDDDDDDMNAAIDKVLNIENNIKSLFREDEDMQKVLSEKLKTILEQQIDNLDEDSLDDWGEVVKCMELDKLSIEILRSERMQKILLVRLTKVLEEYIENNLDTDDLPDNIDKSLQISSRIEAVLNDHDYWVQIRDKIQKRVKEIILNYVDDELNLKEKINNHPGIVDITNKQINEFLLDEQFIGMLTDDLKSKLYKSDELRRELVDMMFTEMAKGMASRLFNKA